MLTITPRATWGARHPDGDKDLTGPAEGVFIHHTVTPQPEPTVEAECAAMRGLEDIGFARFGAAGHGISYNAVIFPSGRVYQGVSWNRRGAHTDGRNSTVRGIAFVGNFQTDVPTDAALEACSQILADGFDRLWTGLILGGHRDIKATACPGDHLYARLPQINARALVLINQPTATTPPTTPAPVPAPAKELLDEDGVRGPHTIRVWQQVMGTPVDDAISRPKSKLIMADQAFLNAAVPAQSIRDLTGKPALDIDGAEGPKTIRVRQYWLHNRLASVVLHRHPCVEDFDGIAGPETTTLHQHALNAAAIGSRRY